MSDLNKFNNNLNTFLNEISESFPDSKKTIEDKIGVPIDVDNTTIVSTFYDNCVQLYDKLYNKDISLLDDILFPNLMLSEIINTENIDETTMDNIWKNIQTLYLYSFSYSNNKSLKSLFKENSENIDDISKKTLDILNSIKKDSKKNVDTETGESTDGLPNMDGLFGGVIGDLANEIAGEIKTSEINLDNPENLLKDLFSGKISDSNSGIGGLIKNIASKVQKKLSDGNLNEEDLLGDAQNIMGGFDGDLLNNLMSGMMANNNMDSLFKKPNTQTVQVSDNNIKLKERRKKLREKLEKKKELLKNKQ